MATPTKTTPTSGRQITSMEIQLIFSFIVLIFCLVSIAAGKTDIYYWATITGILNYWLPSPAQQK